MNDDLFENMPNADLFGDDAPEPTGMDSRVMMFNGQRDTHKHAKTSYATVSLRELFSNLGKPGRMPRVRALALMASSYCEHDGRTHTAQRRRGRFVVLRCDIDKGNHSLAELQAALQAFTGPGVTIGVYSTSSATPDDKCWRGLIPLSMPLGYADWLRLQKALHLHLQCRGIVPDTTMERAGQYIIAPNVKPEQWGQDGAPIFYQWAIIEGDTLDVQAPTVLAALDDLGVFDIAGEIACIEAIEAKAGLASDDAQRRAKSGRGDDTVIGQWLSTHSLTNAFEEHGFETKDGENWHHKIQTSASYSWRDFGEHWVCASESASNHGIGAVSASGFSFGDAFDLYVYFVHKGDGNAAVKAISQEIKVIDPTTGGLMTWHEKTRKDYLADPVNQALMQHVTQDAVALIFRREFEGKLLYAHKFKKWFQWDGRRWCVDDTELASNFARDIARKTNTEGKAAAASFAFCNGVEMFARADRAFAITGAEFDSDNYLLNTPAGVFDLKTNVMRPHDPHDRCTKITTVAPKGGAPTFFRFLSEITDDDNELMEFLHVSLGACLSGATESHWLLFWTGQGRNGKNTLGDLVMWILDGYARKIPASTLMAKKFEGHPTELASLKGIRLATASEVSDGEYWHESRICELTGDAMISARYISGDWFEFERTHKHLIYGNNRPQLRTASKAMEARIKIVPFKQSFYGREDAMLPLKLRHEAEGVLYWLIDGHAKWVKAGRKLPVCASVDRESKDYFASQSTTETWMDDQLVNVDDDQRSGRELPKAGDLYRQYAVWKNDRGESPVSMTRWGESMARRFAKVVSDGVRYRGVSLSASGLPVF